MKLAITSIAVVLLAGLAATAVFAKNCTVGIYAVIDRVTFEPEGSSPKLIRISGVFVVPVPWSSGNYKDPQRGYLYFRIRPGMEQATRKDLNELKAVAGTGQVVGFAEYWIPNPGDPSGNPHHSLVATVHAENSAASPDDYPLPNHKGIVRHGDETDPTFTLIAERLQKASRR
jgi:hypothetical protein